MEQLKTIKELINQGDVAEAIRQLDEYLITDSTDRDEAFYLLGNAYRKQGNWQLALNNSSMLSTSIPTALPVKPIVWQWIS